LDGREVLIEEGGITQPGFVKVIEGEGMPIRDSTERGNLYVKINVQIPDFTED
jgi:DnaJ-related protein SCJ1